MQHYEIFIFVNPKSGNLQGKHFLQNEYDKVEIETKKFEIAILHFLDLTILEKKMKTFKEML